MSFALLAFVFGILAVVVATSTDGAVTAPWWILLAVLCFVLPFGSWSARSARSRVIALAGLIGSSLLLVGGLRVSTSTLLVAIVVAPLALTLAMLLTHHLRGHRVVGAVLFGIPLLLVGAAAPATFGSAEIQALVTLDPSGALPAILEALPPMLLFGGASMLTGSVVDLASRLRTSVSAEAVRGIAYVVGGLALVLVAAAGVVAAGTLSGTASRVGTSATVLVVAAVAALWHGLRTLSRTREVSRVGGAMTVLSVVAVLAGVLLAPAESLATVLSLVALLALAAVLGAVTGLCGAAALVRAPRRERRPLRLGLPLRARAVHSRHVQSRPVHS